MSSAPVTAPHGPANTAMLVRANRIIYLVARHWLLLLNVLAAPFALLPVAAPLARAVGLERTADAIFAMFAPICHQLDDRSFHVAGHRFACCERCFAIYSGLLILGLGYALVRRRVEAASLPCASLLSLPIVADVFSQPAFHRESTWWLRTVTGLLFAAAMSWYLLPRFQNGFGEMTRQIERRFERLVGDGRARPLRSRHLPAASGDS